ncbi:hypothetical protein LTY36_04040 [Limosilactobacillus agrestis]|uniref:Uncharacterized protein n=1 Tax=Limosilactobacillus agrestis TaxID=2759748 RepID=A0ABS8R6F4_9LACO|nr:hypothetical protein [Limosilactobacillus agrestis]MBB1099589.1 hypothetical protein [Limosilactobacillus agrestis]MCD7127219.1 hypothetical protein [Limosilactobacillus agrestis]MCD7130358.1 hypothetical protein [Limosilactobacillus agrestis]
MSAITALQLRSFTAKNNLKGKDLISIIELAGVGISASKLSRMMSLETNNNPTSLHTIKAIEIIFQKRYGTVLFPNNTVKNNYISLIATEYSTIAIQNFDKLDNPTDYLINHINDLTRVSITKIGQIKLLGALLQIYNNDNSQDINVQIQNGLLKFLAKRQLLKNSLDLCFNANVDDETVQLRSIVNIKYSPSATKKLAMQLICQSLFKLIITNDRP